MLDFVKLDIKEKQTSNTILLRLTIRDAAPESYQVRPEALETLKPSYASSKVKTKTMLSEIGFPTLTQQKTQ